MLQERDRLALQLCRKHGRTGKACGIIRANLTNLAVCALSAEAHPPLPSGATWARHLSLSDPDVPLIRNEDRSFATVNVVTPCHSLLPSLHSFSSESPLLTPPRLILAS